MRTRKAIPTASMNSQLRLYDVLSSASLPVESLHQPCSYRLQDITIVRVFWGNRNQSFSRAHKVRHDVLQYCKRMELPEYSHRWKEVVVSFDTLGSDNSQWLESLGFDVIRGGGALENINCTTYHWKHLALPIAMNHIGNGPILRVDWDVAIRPMNGDTDRTLRRGPAIQGHLFLYTNFRAWWRYPPEDDTRKMPCGGVLFVGSVEAAYCLAQAARVSGYWSDETILAACLDIASDGKWMGTERWRRDYELPYVYSKKTPFEDRKLSAAPKSQRLFSIERTK